MALVNGQLVQKGEAFEGGGLPTKSLGFISASGQLRALRKPESHSSQTYPYKSPARLDLAAPRDQSA